MTKKDYELIARVLSEFANDCDKHEHAYRIIGRVSAYMSRELGKDNLRFDSAKFMKACGF